MRALVVDHQPLFADGVASVLRHYHGPGELHNASSIEQALDVVSETPALDLAIICVERPVCGVPRAIRDFIAEAPNVPVLALVSMLDVRMLREVMRAGAQGIVARNISAGTFARAVEKILAGGRYIPEDLPVESALDNGHSTGSSNGSADSDGGSDSDISHLTPRQRDVLQLLALGQSNQEIAGELGIALATVKLHVNAILRSLKVRNRTEAAAMAIVSGLLTPAGAPSHRPDLSDHGRVHMPTPSVD